MALLNPNDLLRNARNAQTQATRTPYANGYNVNDIQGYLGSQYGITPVGGARPHVSTEQGRQIMADAERYGVTPDQAAAAMGWNPQQVQQFVQTQQTQQTQDNSSGATPFSNVATTNAATASNPYLGAMTAYGQSGQGRATASSNPYFGMNNPYTSQAVNAASEAAARNYNLHIAPQRDAQMARSGSFGNTGVQQMQLEDQRNLQGTLGNIANNAYMQDLWRQQNMGESAANRETGVSQYNAGLGAQLGMFDAGLAQQLGMFNAGQQNQLGMFNAGQQNQMNQFDQNMDFNAWQANNNLMQQGVNNQMGWINTLGNLAGIGINSANANNLQPLQNWQQFANTGAQLGGLGGTGSNTQNLQGNPYLGALGGALTGWNLWNGMNRG